MVVCCGSSVIFRSSCSVTASMSAAYVLLRVQSLWNAALPIYVLQSAQHGHLQPMQSVKEVAMLFCAMHTEQVDVSMGFLMSRMTLL